MSKGKLSTPPIPKIRELMDENEVKREDIATALGVSTVAIGQYYNGDTLPSIENLIKIADYFNVSTDYLLGRTDIKTRDTDLKTVCEYMGISEQTVWFLHCQNEIDDISDNLKFVKLTESIINHHFYTDFLSCLDTYFDIKFKAEKDTNIENDSIHKYIFSQNELFSEKMLKEISRITQYENNMVIPYKYAESFLKKRVEDCFSDMLEHLYYEWKRDIGKKRGETNGKHTRTTK